MRSRRKLYALVNTSQLDYMGQRTYVLITGEPSTSRTSTGLYDPWYSLEFLELDLVAFEASGLLLLEVLLGLPSSSCWSRG
jgi:hypothetical protein